MCRKNWWEISRQTGKKLSQKAIYYKPIQSDNMSHHMKIIYFFSSSIFCLYCALAWTTKHIILLLFPFCFYHIFAWFYNAFAFNYHWLHLETVFLLKIFPFSFCSSIEPAKLHLVMSNEMKQHKFTFFYVSNNMLCFYYDLWRMIYFNGSQKTIHFPLLNGSQQLAAFWRQK